MYLELIEHFTPIVESVFSSSLLKSAEISGKEFLSKYVKLAEIFQQARMRQI